MSTETARLRIFIRAIRLDLADPRLPTTRRRAMWAQLVELQRELLGETAAT
jgi:hypothetical protein